MIGAVLSGFGLAVLMPLISSRSITAARAGATALPALLFVYFAGLIGPVTDGQAFTAAYAWVPSLGIALAFHLDGLSLLFALLISGLGALVFAYAGAYLPSDELGRFYGWILAFMASMLGVVLADDFLSLFVFWELTSFSSYMLIGFNHERTAARAAALQALLVTGGGGLAFLAGLLLLRIASGVDRFSELAAAGSLAPHDLFAPILILLLAGALTKSAQFPFYFWLPSAMEAPAPVSAYLHSATMVKAGVYLLARISPAFSESDLWLYGVTGAGAITMLIGGFLAIGQKDMKLALAYSTVSALGMMVMLLGLGSETGVEAALLFLLGHALYKGALFLVAGGVDHGAGTRDLTALSGLRRGMPRTAAVAGLAALSMAAAPPLFGYVGKEFVLEAVLHAPWMRAALTAATAVTSMLFLAVALKVGFAPFWGRPAPTPHAPHEGPWPLWGGPATLAVLGVLLGLGSGIVAPLISAAATAVRAAPVEVELGLWHGWTPALALSLAVFGGGFALYAARSGFVRVTAPLARRIESGPPSAYRAVLEGMNRTADLQTRLLQSGFLRNYLLIIIAAMGVLVLYPMLDLLPVAASLAPAPQFHEIVVAFMIVAAAFTATGAHSTLTAVAALGVSGYGVALLYFLFGAPDLALTQFVVETLTVILFVLVLYHLPPFIARSSRVSRARDVAVAGAVGAIVASVALLAMDGELDLSIPRYYAEASYPLAHGRNIVNVILVDFRALDTLGEITVLGVAAIGVYALLRTRSGSEGT